MRHSHFFHLLLLFGCLFCLSACESGRTNYAPVTDISPIEPIPKSGVYRVKGGDTLYSIAWRYGLDYQKLAAGNNLASPDAIQTGELLYLRGHAKAKKTLAKTIVTTKPIQKPIKVVTRVMKEPTAAPRVWHWPARGPVMGTFGGFNKGINIGGQRNDPISAAAAGKVVYCGNGLRAYGNLIIIKHNAMYLSAYANNNRVYVKQGDFVAAGQKIAEMGQAVQGHFMLHFEIRRNGLPVNPLIYLTK